MSSSWTPKPTSIRPKTKDHPGRTGSMEQDHPMRQATVPDRLDQDASEGRDTDTARQHDRWPVGMVQAHAGPRTAPPDPGAQRHRSQDALAGTVTPVPWLGEPERHRSVGDQLPADQAVSNTGQRRSRSSMCCPVEACVNRDGGAGEELHQRPAAGHDDAPAGRQPTTPDGLRRALRDGCASCDRHSGTFIWRVGLWAPSARYGRPVTMRGDACERQVNGTDLRYATGRQPWRTDQHSTAMRPCHC